MKVDRQEKSGKNKYSKVDSGAKWDWCPEWMVVKGVDPNVVKNQEELWSSIGSGRIPGVRFAFPLFHMPCKKKNKLLTTEILQNREREDTRPHPTDKRHLADVTTTNLRYITER